jgi:hypothetical protein
MTASTIVENLLRPHFQKQIVLTIGDEEYKSGKFVLFQSSVLSNNFYIEFQIQTEKRLESVKIPYPFNYESYPDEGLIYFDYRLKALTKKQSITSGMEQFAQQQDNIDNNKFYNKILEIQFN